MDIILSNVALIFRV